MPDKPIYERLEGESPRAFAAFVIYRNMGVKRSLDKVQVALSNAETKSENDNATNQQQTSNKKRANGQIGGWSASELGRSRLG
jgi:hypothetical protein